MPMLSYRPIIIRLLFLLAFCLANWWPTLIHAAPITAPTAGPDLIIQSLTVNPPNPGAGSTGNITVVIKNQGDANAGGFRIHLYVESPDDPPTVTTPHTSTTFYGLGLAPGQTFTYERTGQSFAAANPIIWAWVDRDSQVAEGDEGNNQARLPALVPPPPPDAFEEDDTCAVAQPLATDGTVQAHTLARTPGADEDWVKFIAIGGVTYYAVAAAVGADADLYLELLDRCDGPPGLGAGASITFTAPADAVYYLKVGSNPEPYGPDTRYTLSLTGENLCNGNFEPNDQCSLAGDVAVGASSQAHSFCQPGDADWLRFEVAAGAHYRAQATNVGANVDAQLSLYPSCDVPNSEQTSRVVEFTTASAGTLFLKATNVDASRFGPNANYTVQVELIGPPGCSEDALEQDDSQGAAKTLTVDGAAQTHNTCPAGEQDWAQFQAASGVPYVLQTGNLGAEADTLLCLYDSGGTQLACDDDSGPGYASRLTFTPATAGLYALSVHDFNAEHAGDQTSYELRVHTNPCAADAAEPDNESSTAKPIVPDGTTQTHNFCPEQDADWVTFSAPAGLLTIHTSGLGEEADTVLALYDAANNLLAGNDDYSADLSSKIFYTSTNPGNYFVRVTNYNPTRYGEESHYQLGVNFAANPTPTPTPTPTAPPPTPTPPPPTSTPPPTNVKTLILYNRARIVQLYDEASATQLTDKLIQLANRSEVAGEIIRLDNNQTVASAYAAWAGNQSSVEAANLVTAAIRRVIMTYLRQHGGVEYVVLVGDDRALPFRRVRDYTGYPESTYGGVNANSPTGAALLADYYLTDDYLVDQEPTTVNGREVYLPDLAIGRLVETPTDIIGLIDRFMLDATLDGYKVLVTGYDFVDDAARSVCEVWREDLGNPGNSQLDCGLISESWSLSDYRSRQLTANPPYKIQSINGHAAHNIEGAPGSGGISASDIANSSSELDGGLIYTLGCHSGLNVPPGNPGMLDLPEAFARKRASYVGNTGYGWGLLGAVGLSERMVIIYTQELTKDGAARMGKALMSTKRLYFEGTHPVNAYDEKVVQQMVFYGLPMTIVQSGAILEEGVEFPGVQVVKSAPTGTLGDVLTRTLSIDFKDALANHTSTTTTANGQYLSLADHTFAAAGEPIQPLFFADINEQQEPARGVLLRAATFTDRPNFDPVVAAPFNEYFSKTTESQLANAAAWYPPVPLGLQRLDDASNLVSQLGSYNPLSQTLRLYNTLEVEAFYSASADQSGPEIKLVDSVVVNNQVAVKVGTSDVSGVREVVVAYFEEGGQAAANVKSVNLSYNPAAQKWLGAFPGSASSRYFVQIVDQAGNVTTATNKNQYYEPAMARNNPTASGSRIYLPLVAK